MQLKLNLPCETINPNDLISDSSALINRFGQTRYFRMKEYAFNLQNQNNQLKIFK